MVKTSTINITDDKKKYNNTTVIIPTLNERKNIGELLEIIASSYPGIKVIVADDNSKDGTQEIVSGISEKNRDIKLLERKSGPKGLTASVIRAFKESQTKYTLVIDGDLQHPPEKIKEIVKALGRYYIVVGRRRSVADWRLDRRIMSSVATMLAKSRLMFKKTRCNDIMSGFFGMKTDIFKESLERSEDSYEHEGYKVLFDFLKQNKKRLSLKEIDYDFGMRHNGDSKIGIRQIKAFLRSLFK
ncbi:MAG: glycosyltransferase [Candidatus Woesearchaeota archaeon]